MLKYFYQGSLVQIKQVQFYNLLLLNQKNFWYWLFFDVTKGIDTAPWSVANEPVFCLWKAQTSVSLGTDSNVFGQRVEFGQLWFWCSCDLEDVLPLVRKVTPCGSIPGTLQHLLRWGRRKTSSRSQDLVQLPELEPSTLNWPGWIENLRGCTNFFGRRL